MSPTKEGEMVSKAQHDIRRKRQVLDYAAQHGAFAGGTPYEALRERLQ